ncbi:hypothetical protein ABZ093_06705 [Streptomyces cyaneofuscatus]|uniref:hypothetical protein n=1 Tax=Streptomyces cyaneofuscatus TaxID=66883 RepID=UPI0033B068E9
MQSLYDTYQRGGQFEIQMGAVGRGERLGGGEGVEQRLLGDLDDPARLVPAAAGQGARSQGDQIDVGQVRRGFQGVAGILDDVP